MSLDGYDSETDEWMEGDDARLQEYEVSADTKEAARKTADEKTMARLHSEARRHDGRKAFAQATAVDLS